MSFLGVWIAVLTILTCLNFWSLFMLWNTLFEQDVII